MAVSSARRVAGNLASLLASDITTRASTFILYALVARYLSTFEFGQLSLALTFFYVFQILAAAGLKLLITRQVAHEPARAGSYFVNGSLVALGNSLLALLALAGTAWLMGYAPQTTLVILLLGLGIVPFALMSVCEAVFQGLERMRPIAVANITANGFKLALTLALLTGGYGLLQLVLALAGSYLVALFVEWWLLLRLLSPPRLPLELPVARTLVGTTLPFFGIDAVIAITSSLNILLLSRLASEVEVGLFSSSTQLLVPMGLLCQTLATSVYPIMCRRFASGDGEIMVIVARLVELLFALALPMAVGLFFLAAPTLVLLYGQPAFAEAAWALRIMCWTVPLVALTSVLGQGVLASLQERQALRIVVIDALVGLALGLVLIGRYGLTGAAVAMLLTRVVDFAQHYIVAARVLPGLPLARLSWKPLVAGGCMAAFLALAPGGHVVPTAALAGLIYVSVLLALAVWASGGPRRFRLRYLYLLSR